ncbi:hypothetical protein [Oleidesulfovibrio sp.]|uniref:hypothetical protein n=1 Tax=Oleidesulfovibrio sp. TaxID=2909707 RepID=UPI003A88C3C8
MKKMLLLTLLLLLSGCAAGGNIPNGQEELYTQKALGASQKVYTDVTQEQVLQAAEKILLLADPEDTIVSQRRDGISAKREFFRYLILSASTGTDYWTVAAKQTTSGIAVQVAATAEQAYVLGPESGSRPVADNSILEKDIIASEALYSLFYERLDYLLGKKKQWLDCSAAKDVMKKKQWLGDIDLLCGRGTSDARP